MEDAKEEALAELAQKWLEAKEAEAGWADVRARLEAEILELAEVKEEGSKTTNVGRFKVRTTARVYRSVDAEAWEQLRDSIPEDMRDVVEYKPKVNTRGFKWIRDNAPEVFERLAEAITSKQGKTGVNIEEVEE